MEKYIEKGDFVKRIFGKNYTGSDEVPAVIARFKEKIGFLPTMSFNL
jgi:hypothetical protein